MYGATAPSGPLSTSKGASIPLQILSFPYSQIVFCLSVPSAVFFMFSLHKCFYQVKLSVSSQPSTWSSGASLAALVITFDLSGMGDPASSYATACIVFRIL